MRLARPVYECLPYIYMGIGGLAMFVFHLDPVGPRAIVAFVIGFMSETAALTLLLRRMDFRALNRDYSGETIDFPSSLRG